MSKYRWKPGILLCAITAGLASLSPLLADGEVGTPLAPELLASSRGRDIDNVLMQKSCNNLNQNFSCPTPGGSCNSCDGNTYTDTTGGENGGYDPSGKPNIVNSCGVNYLGSCMAGSCSVDKTQQVGVCQTPPAPPTPQP